MEIFHSIAWNGKKRKNYISFPNAVCHIGSLFVSDIVDEMERVPHEGPTGPGDPGGPYPGGSTGVHIAEGGSAGGNIGNMEAQGNVPPRETITGNECHVCG